MRYDRELVQTTVKAIKRISEIKQKREHAFWKHRYARAYPTQLFVLTSRSLQDGCEQRKVTCTPQEEVGEVEGICQAGRTYRYRTLWGREDSGENQDPVKITKCPCTGRGQVDGHGYRLSASFLCSFFITIDTFAHAWGGTTKHVHI